MIPPSFWKLAILIILFMVVVLGTPTILNIKKVIPQLICPPLLFANFVSLTLKWQSELVYFGSVLLIQYIQYG
jgi:hypothetical protein